MVGTVCDMLVGSGAKLGGASNGILAHRPSRFQCLEKKWKEEDKGLMGLGLDFEF